MLNHIQVVENSRNAEGCGISIICACKLLVARRSAHSDWQEPFRPSIHAWVHIRTLQCPYYNLLIREMKVDGQLPLSGGNAGQERLERFRVVACSCGCHSKGEGRHLRVPTCVEPDPRDLCIVRLLVPNP